MPLIEGRSSASSALLLRRVFSDAAAKAPTISSGTRSTAARPANPTKPCASARRTKPVQPPVVPEVSGLENLPNPRHIEPKDMARFEACSFIPPMLPYR